MEKITESGEQRPLVSMTSGYEKVVNTKNCLLVRPAVARFLGPGVVRANRRDAETAILVHAEF
jgi:hypothetical protein